MSDIFTLDLSEPKTSEANQGDTTEAAAPAAGGFRPPAATSTAASSSAKTGKKAKRDEPALPYKPLPEPKLVKAPSAREQKKIDKEREVKLKEARAAALRINGSDDDVVIPKKPFLTIASGKRAKPPEISESLTDLAQMLESGQSEKSAVATLATQYKAYDIGQAYERVLLLLGEGISLSGALADQTDNFPPVVRELLATAKVSKDMHRNLRQSALIILEAGNIKAKIQGALFKPGFLAFCMLAFMFAAMQWLLPMTAAMFSDIGSTVPPLTALAMGIAAWLKWVVLAVIVGSLLFMAVWNLVLKRTKALGIMGDRFALKAPLVGEIARMATAARLCDVLAACLGVGMSEIEALETAGRASGNKALQQWVEEHVGRQRYGIVNFSDVSDTELLPWNFKNRIQVTTSLPRRIEVLQELAKTFHEKSQERLNRFAERIGPLSEGLVVVVILAVVLLVITPIAGFIPTLVQSLGI